LEDHLDQEGELDQDVIPLGVRKQVADDPESDTDFKAGSDIEPDQDDEADQGEVDAMDLDDEIGDNNSNTVKEPSSQMKKKVVGQNQKKGKNIQINSKSLQSSSTLLSSLLPNVKIKSTQVLDGKNIALKETLDIKVKRGKKSTKKNYKSEKVVRSRTSSPIQEVINLGVDKVEWKKITKPTISPCDSMLE